MTGCLVAIGVLVLSGLASLVAGRRGRVPSVLGAAGAVIAAAFALPSTIASLGGAPPSEIVVEWAAPLDQIRLGLDPLSAFFVVPLVVLGATCGIYGAFYFDEQRTRRWIAAPICFYNLLIAAMLLVLISRDAIVFVMAWEVMTLASYLLITFDHVEAEVRDAGWVYLVASHLGIACVLSMFLLLGHDGLGFADMYGEHGTTATVAALLGLVGFGVKAGIVPLHVWLPDAHAAAPSHVSALMSGVLIKLGIYGILRTITFVGPESFPWGSVLLVLGTIGALVGISLALYQRDVKRTLAYSSVENIGVILIGLGIGMWGSTNDHPTIAALGLCGGLFHVWNHVIMKGLMFLGAGNLLHGAGTRDLEQMGGLLKRMPRTGALVIIGAVAIAGLPPLNGFASEWLMYLGLARGGTETGSGGLLLLFGVAVLGLVGVMAAACFVRLIGMTLLGQPRSAAAADAHESHRGLVGPMVFLVALAIAMPFLLPLLVTGLEPLIRQVTGTSFDLGGVTDVLAPISILSAVLWGGLVLAYLAIRRMARRRRAAETWGCGYVAPTSRMQYSGASFAEGLHRLLPRVLRARMAVHHSTELFPAPEQLSADRQDPFTRSAYEPLLDRFASRFGQLRWVQQGMLHLYILYIVLTVVVTITIVSIRDYWVLP